eukprot:COSAG02_NODE_72642_length_183_cov_5.916667_1_plen_33_part_01
MVLLLVGSCEPWSRPLQKIFDPTRHTQNFKTNA